MSATRARPDATVEAESTLETEQASLARFTSAWDEFFGAARRARGRAAQEVLGGELTLPQFHLLVAFDDSRERPVGALAEAAGVSPPTATRMLDGLERNGVVERRPSSDDRRVVTVRLTPKGRRLLRRKRKRVAEKRRAVFHSLDPADRVGAERLLRRLAAAIDEL